MSFAILEIYSSSHLARFWVFDIFFLQIFHLHVFSLSSIFVRFAFHFIYMDAEIIKYIIQHSIKKWIRRVGESSDVAMEAVAAAYNIRRETPFYYYLHLFSVVFHHTRRRLRGGSELYQFSPYIMMACGIKKSSSTRNEVSRAVAPLRGGPYIPCEWDGGKRVV